MALGSTRSIGLPSRVRSIVTLGNAHARWLRGLRLHTLAHIHAALQKLCPARASAARLHAFKDTLRERMRSKTRCMSEEAAEGGGWDRRHAVPRDRDADEAEELRAGVQEIGPPGGGGTVGPNQKPPSACAEVVNGMMLRSETSCSSWPPRHIRTPTRNQGTTLAGPDVPHHIAKDSGRTQIVTQNKRRSLAGFRLS